MALATYQDLQDAIKAWLEREDTATIGRIPDFIVFAEKKIFRRLRSRLNEKKFTTDVDTANGITLPADFKEVKLLLWDSRPLIRRSDQWYFENEPAGTPSQTPLYFARTLNDEIEFWSTPDEDAQVDLIYYYEPDPISDVFVPDQFLEAPDLYLYGALIEAQPFLKKTNPEYFAIWSAKFQETWDDLMDESWEDELSGGTIEVSGAYPDSTLSNRALYR